MKKKTLILLITSLIIIALLVGGIVFINSYEKEEEIDEALVITSFDEDDVESIIVSNEENEFSFSFYNIEKSGKKERLLRLDGYENIPSTESLYENLLKNTLTLTASKNFGEVQDISDYGFDKPYTSFTLNTKKGDTVTVVFGALAPDNSGIYAKKEGSDTVYLVKKSIADSLKQNKNNFFSKTLFSYGSTEVLDVEKIELSGGCRENVTVEPYEDESSAHLFKITSPKTCFADDEKIAEILYFLTLSPSADSIEVLNATDSDFEEYGLKNPYSKIHFEFEKATEEISFSEEKDGIIFAKINTTPVIYALKAEDFLAYNYTFKELESSKLFSCNINYLDTFKIMTGGEDFEISVDADKNKAICNGKEIDYQTFANYYASFLSINKSADYDKAKAGKEIIRIDISFRHDRKAQTLSYYEYNGSYYCFIDGKSVGEVDLSDFIGKTEGFTSDL